MPAKQFYSEQAERPDVPWNSSCLVGYPFPGTLFCGGEQIAFRKSLLLLHFTVLKGKEQVLQKKMGKFFICICSVLSHCLSKTIQ